MNSYCQTLKDYMNKGETRKLSKFKAQEQWFLLQFLAPKKDIVTTKVRVAFDAAMKHDREIINDAIRPGTKLQRELVDVLTRFRWSPVVLSGDIAEMFLQVELQKKDRQCHWFLWRNPEPSRAGH